MYMCIHRKCVHVVINSLIDIPPTESLTVKTAHPNENKASGPGSIKVCRYEYVKELVRDYTYSTCTYNQYFSSGH